MLVAPVVAQLNVLLEPEVMLAGLALKELIFGLLAAFTVTVSVEVVEPAEPVAVSVYVVVSAGLTLVVPLADAEVNVPGVMAIVVAPFVSQIRVVLSPGSMPAGLAVKEVMAGIVPLSDDELDEPQPGNPAKHNRTTTRAQWHAAEKRPVAER